MILFSLGIFITVQHESQETPPMFGFTFMFTPGVLFFLSHHAVSLRFDPVVVAIDRRGHFIRKLTILYIYTYFILDILVSLPHVGGLVRRDH